MDRQHQQSLPDFSRDRIESLTTGLRRLARGLVRSEADADDLVQDVWVAALRNRPDDEGRLDGWFRRTLRNTASDRRRDDARRARREAVAASPEAVSGDEHEQFETLRALLSEVEALEEPYRSAVRLRFLEGEPPRRIAKRLGVPVATVHSRIRRGLARLRERLDARSGGDRKAWLAALAPWARPEGALLGAGALAGLVVLMKTQMVAVVALVVLGAGGALALWMAQPDSTRTVAAEESEGLTRSEARAAHVSAEVGAEVERAEVVEPEADPQESVVAAARVRGRCIDDVTGAPLEGVTAKFRGRSLGPEGIGEQAGSGEWRDLEPVVTDADGVFEAAFEANSDSALRLELSVEGYAPRMDEWGTFDEAVLVAGRVDDLGDVRMLRGSRVTGQVVDDDGLAMNDVFIGLDKLPLRIRGSLDGSSLVAESGPEGRFEISAPVPHGTWPLRTFRGEYLIGPRTVTVPLVEPLIVRTTAQRLVSGRVLDRSGEPIGGVYVEAFAARGRAAGAAWADADGRFVLAQRKPGDDPPTQISVHDLHRGRRVVRTRLDVALEWGQQDVEVRVERTGQVELHVVDGESGDPIERFAIKLYPRQGDGGTIRDIHCGGEHPGGAFSTWGLHEGENVLMVFPEDSGWQVSEPRLVAFRGDPVEPIEVRLIRSLAVPVLVVDDAGKPLEGVEVELVDPGEERENPVGISSPVFPRPSILQGEKLFEADRSAYLFDRRITDSEGVCRLAHDPRVDGEVVVRLGKAGFEPVLHRVTIEPGQRFEFELMRSAAVMGRLVSGNGGYAQARPKVWLVDPGAEEWSSGQTYDLQGDGSFALSEVPAGSYELRFGLQHRITDLQSGHGAFLKWREPLRKRVEVSSGARVDLGDLPVDPRPATVSGSVRVGGAVPVDARLWFLASDDSPWEGVLGTYPITAGGRFEIHELPPGRWWGFVGVGMGSGDCAGWSRAREVFEVGPGERADVSIEVPRRVVSVRVVDEAGSGLVGRRVWIEPKESLAAAHRFARVTDQDGRMTLDPAPDVPFQFRVDGHRRLEPSQPVEVEPSAGTDGEPVEILLRLRTG